MAKNDRKMGWIIINNNKIFSSDENKRKYDSKLPNGTYFIFLLKHEKTRLQGTHVLPQRYGPREYAKILMFIFPATQWFSERSRPTISITKTFYRKKMYPKHVNRSTASFK